MSNDSKQGEKNTMAKTIQAKVSDEDNAAFVEAITELGYSSKSAAAAMLVQLFLEGKVQLPEA